VSCGDAKLFLVGSVWIAYTPTKTPMFLSQPKFIKKYISKKIKLGRIYENRGIKRAY
jgi:hypothetical protein